VVQVGIIVRDINQAAQAWAKLLRVEEPPVIETEGWESSHMTFKGKPSKGRAKLAFFKLENIAVELIQPIGSQSTWQDFLAEHGDGIHHIAFTIDNPEETLDRLEGMGIGVEQRGDYKGGCYVYANSEAKLGAVIELLHSHV